jgi:hypothetical protein
MFLKKTYSCYQKKTKNIFFKIEMINHKIIAYIYFKNLNNIKKKSKDPYIKFQIIDEKIKLYHL